MIVGIDPGLTGAIAFLTFAGARVLPIPTLNITKTKKTFDENEIRRILAVRAARVQHVFIEKVAAMPKQGVTSMFNFGAGWGLLRGICVGLQLPYTLIAPQTWKKEMCKDLPKGSKDVSIIVAKRIWPSINLKPTPRCKKDSDGMADALMLAEYGRRSRFLKV